MTVLSHLQINNTQVIISVSAALGVSGYSVHQILRKVLIVDYNLASNLGSNSFLTQICCWTLVSGWLYILCWMVKWVSIHTIVSVVLIQIFVYSEKIISRLTFFFGFGTLSGNNYVRIVRHMAIEMFENYDNLLEKNWHSNTMVHPHSMLLLCRNIWMSEF